MAVEGKMAEGYQILSPNMYLAQLDNELVRHFNSGDENWLQNAITSEMNAMSNWATGFLNVDLTLVRLQQIRRELKNAVRDPQIPWIGGAVDKRFAYTYQGGMFILGDKMEDKIQNFRKSNYLNKKAITNSWWTQYNMELCVSGNVFKVTNKETKGQFFLDLDEVQEFIVDNDDKSFILAIMRTDALGDTYVIKRRGVKIADSVIRKAFGQDRASGAISETNKIKISDIYEFDSYHAKRAAGQALAYPVLGLATIYCLAAARLLSDLSRYKHIASLIVLKAQSNLKEGAERAIENIGQMEKSGVFGYTSDLTLTGGNANQLNIANTGEIPYLAAAATSVCIPVSDFTMSVMGMGGSQSSLTTLSRTVQAYFANEQLEAQEIVRDILGDEAYVQFIPSTPEEKQKLVNTYQTFYEQNAISIAELRKIISYVYNLGLSGEIPNYDTNVAALAVEFQMRMADKYRKDDTPNLANPDDPNNEGGENDARGKDKGVPGQGKRTITSE